MSRDQGTVKVQLLAQSGYAIRIPVLVRRAEGWLLREAVGLRHCADRDGVVDVEAAGVECFAIEFERRLSPATSRERDAAAKSDTILPILRLTAGVSNGHNLDFACASLPIDKNKRKLPQQKTSSTVRGHSPALRSLHDLYQGAINFGCKSEGGVGTSL
jgi:hypothetical protein